MDWLEIIMGANIGSTATAQIVAFNVTRCALMMIALGFVMLFAGKRDKIRQWGSMIMGLGLVDALKRTFTLARRIARIEAPKVVIDGEAV